MTNEAMIEALRRAIVDAVEEAFETDDCPNEAAAAAVLELVKPKRLVWESLSGSGQFYRANAPLFGSVRVENYGRGFNVLWSVPGYCDTLVPGSFASAEAAQAAAQAHADAAHWANTALGELVGGV